MQVLSNRYLAAEYFGKERFVQSHVPDRSDIRGVRYAERAQGTDTLFPETGGLCNRANRPCGTRSNQKAVHEMLLGQTGRPRNSVTWAAL